MPKLAPVPPSDEGDNWLPGHRMLNNARVHHGRSSGPIFPVDDGYREARLPGDEFADL